MNFMNRAVIIAMGLLAAQAVLPTSAFGDGGDGVQSEEGWKLVPSLKLSGRYNSNIYRAAGNETAGLVVDAPILGINPAVAISSPRERDFLLDLDAGIQWDQYFDTAGIAGVDVSRQSGLSVSGKLGAHINPEGSLSLRLEEVFSRRNEPGYSGSKQPYNWINNAVGAVVGIRPSAGVLGIDLGYRWRLFDFDNKTLSDLNRFEHDFDLKIAWDFLPKTALLLDGNFRMVRWDHPQQAAVRDDLTLPVLHHYNHNPLRVQAGLDGLLTERLALRLLAGYGMSMHDEGESFGGVIGSASVSYAFGRLDLQNKLSLGYQRDFRTAAVGNFYGLHQVFGRYVQNLLDRRVSMHLGGRFEWRDYSLDSTPLLGEPLKDALVIGDAGVEVQATEWLGFGFGYQLTANLTDNEYTIPAVDPRDPTVTVLRSYVQHVALLSTTLRY